MEKIIFEDLPSTNTPLNADNLNQIQENVENAINDLNENLDEEIVEVNKKFNYSTEEQKIGTWIDGKPIYRKVKQVNKVSGSNLDIPFDGVETMIRVYGNLISNGGIIYGDLMRYEASTNYTKVIYYPEYKKAMFISGTDSACNGLANIVFEYTKTTD